MTTRPTRWMVTGVATILSATMLSLAADHPADHDDHDHDHDHDTLATASIRERLAADCEHGVRLVACDECRYEGGFVKLDPCVMAQADGRGLVQTGTVETRAPETVIEATGEIIFNDARTVHIAPRVEGIVKRVLVDIGDRVHAGDTLFEIDSVELGRTVADYIKSRRLADLTLKTLERERALFEQNVSPEAALIEAQMAYEEQRANTDAAEQMLHVLGVSPEDAAMALTNAHSALSGVLPFRAPLAGTVVDRHATIGERVEPGSDVMLLSDISTLWVAVDLRESVVARIDALPDDAQLSLAISVDGHPGRSFPCTLDRIGVRMDETTRTIKLRGIVDNPEGLLRAGMFCRVQLGFPAGNPALAVPKSAVLTDEGETFVFVRVEDTLYARQNLTLGRAGVTHVEVLDGLKEGDTLVTTGAFLLKSDVLREKMGAGCAD